MREVFAAGGNLDDVWTDPFFGAIRDWQHRYGYRQPGERRIVTTPAYMSSGRISEVAEGIAKSIDALLEMAGEPRPEKAHAVVAQGRA